MTSPLSVLFSSLFTWRRRMEKIRAVGALSFDGVSAKPRGRAGRRERTQRPSVSTAAYKGYHGKYAPGYLGERTFLWTCQCPPFPFSFHTRPANSMKYSLVANRLSSPYPGVEHINIRNRPRSTAFLRGPRRVPVPLAKSSNFLSCGKSR